MLTIPRDALDALVGTGGRTAAVLISLPDEDHPDLTVRGLTVLHRSGPELVVTTHLLVLEGDTYVEQGSAGGVTLGVEGFVPNLVYDVAPAVGRRRDRLARPADREHLRSGWRSGCAGRAPSGRRERRDLRLVRSGSG